MANHRERLCIPVVATVACALLLAACSGGGGPSATTLPPPPDPGPDLDPATLSGTISVYLPQIENILETEPNDAFDQAHFLGDFRAGRTAAVVGHAGSADERDGFRLLAPERLRVGLELEFQGTGDPQFEVGVWDVAGLQFVERFSAGDSPVTGEFHVKGVVDLIVTPLQGEGDYILTLIAATPASRIDEREPNDALYEGQFLGEALVGDVVNVTGRAQRSTDPFDGVTLSCPSAVRVSFFLFVPDTGLPEPAEFDLWVYDITAGEAEPPLIAQAAWGGESVAAAVDVPAGTLVQLLAECTNDSATYLLQVRGLEPQVGGAVSANLAPADAYGTPSAQFVEGEAVILPDGARLPRLNRELESRHCRLMTSASRPAARIAIDLPAGLSPADRRRYTLRAIRCLERSPSVRRAEPNYLLFAHVEPDDTHYNLQWHYPLINLPRAWDITTGDDAVVVAVIDTGSSGHPDLAARQFGGYDFISDASRARDGDGLDADPTDEGDLGLPNGASTFHGSHVAGTIGAVTNNGLGVSAVTWSTRIMHLRALGVGGGTSFDVANAILYAAGLENGSGTVPALPARIINMSLGGEGQSQLISDAVRDARNAGVVVFASSGNSNSDQPFYPASDDGVVSVGAVDALGLRSYYSNYGPTLDIVAPGGDLTADANGDGWADGVLSARMDDRASPAQPVYSFFQGTSMACPHAAGVAALMLAADPDLTPDDVEGILEDTAQDVGAEGIDDEHGHGLIDAYAAILSTIGAGPPEISPQLKLSATAVTLPPEENTRRILISNIGGQVLNVDAPEILTHGEVNWLQATLLPPTVGSADTSGVEITVSRAGLEDGVYFGRVQLDSNGGTESIQVLMRVESGPPAPPDIEIFVRVVNVDTGDVARQVFLNPATSLDFTLDDVPPGTYRLEAGSDTNGNGIPCEEGELCGVYPVLESPILITLQPGDDRGPFEFTVSPPTSLALGMLPR